MLGLGLRLSEGQAAPAITARQQHLAEAEELERLRGGILRGSETADARDGLLVRRGLRREQYPA